MVSTAPAGHVQYTSYASASVIGARSLMESHFQAAEFMRALRIVTESVSQGYSDTPTTQAQRDGTQPAISFSGVASTSSTAIAVGAAAVQTNHPQDRPPLLPAKISVQSEIQSVCTHSIMMPSRWMEFLGLYANSVASPLELNWETCKTSKTTGTFDRC